MTPVVIGGLYGVLHPAAGRHGVVICSSLGDEVLNMHRSQVFLAERLAGAGFPTLRISYYGTGDSAGEDGGPERLGAWIDSIVQAVHWLRAHCGVGAVSFCGFRIGAALAARAACELDDVDALIMLAPVATGRRFLRELVFAARSEAEIWQSRSAIEDGQWFEAHGLRIDRATRVLLDRLDIGQLEVPIALRVLVLEQVATPGTRNVIERWRGRGLGVTHEICEGLDRMLQEPHASEAPRAAFTRAVNWLGVGACEPTGRRGTAVGLEGGVLDLGRARERAVQFGPGGMLSGILTVPTQRAEHAPVILVANTGASPRWGNARGIVTLARWLAESGIASMRIDISGTGDAALETGERGQPYSRQGDQDVIAGVEFLAARFDRPVIVLGMCSGAYHAFQAALRERRISGLVLVNLQKFVWHEGESLTVMQRTTFRTTRFYLRNLVSLSVWRRLLAGDINVSGIAAALAGRAVRHVAAMADPVIAGLSGETEVGLVRRQVGELEARSVPILYILSGNDPGLDEIAEYFGVRGWRLRRHGNVTFRLLEGADHTLSAYWAREQLRQSIALYLRRDFGVAIDGAIDTSARTAAGHADCLRDPSPLAVASLPVATGHPS